jgi:RimJ/RimL family protein N-acetyltransferase
MYQLRELEKKDLPKVNKWRNNPDLIALLGAPFRFINLNVDEKWFESYMANRGNTIRCAIVEGDNDDILGLVSLVSIDYMNQSAEFHIMIGDKDNQGKGIGTFAVNAMLQHAFYNMNLQRIELTVLEDNERARHLYEKVGFIQEGIKRKAKYKNGKFINMIVYSILKEEYKSVKPSEDSGVHMIPL